MADAENIWGTPFIEPEGLNALQLLIITTIYAVVLYQASNLIANGSEFLVLVPAVSGIVGSIVLPILGAVPDGMMTLVSGLGPNAQESVGAGVGVLAGSTVMLLTFPWFIAVLYGRVPLNDNNEPVYSREKALPIEDRVGLFNSGIGLGPSIKKNTVVMLATSLIYLVIQIPAWGEDIPGEPLLIQVTHEHNTALIGAIISLVCFLGYLVMCFRDSKDKSTQLIIAGIQNNSVSLRAALRFADTDKDKEKLATIIRPFFSRYDQNKDGKLCREEFGMILNDLGESNLIKDEVNKMFRTTDTDSSNSISFEEFRDFLITYLTEPDRNEILKHRTDSVVCDEEEEIAADNEDEEMPADIKSCPVEQQMCRLICRASWMMMLGTFVVLFVSDPFVDCLTEWGTQRRLGIPVFYISFIVAPFASNASELLSAYAYALKKTKSSITTSLSTLIGAGCMNNTFCLGIFFALIYCKGLAWQFTAETISIIVVQWLIGGLALFKTTHNLFIGYLILLCYPLCLFIVYFLENIVGWD